MLTFIDLIQELVRGECDVMKKAGIYYIKDKTNDKYYIGQSEDVERRLKSHFREYKYNKSNIHDAMLEKGIDNFEGNIITRCDISELDQLEIKYIKEYNSYYLWDNGGYNKTLGGKHCDGVVISEKQKKHQSEVMTGKYVGENNPNYNNKWNENQKERMKEQRINLLTREKNGQSKIVVCENEEYGSVQVFADKYNLPIGRVTQWLSRKRLPLEWYVLGLHYKEDNFNIYKRSTKNTYNCPKNINGKAVVCNGVEYPSASELKRQLELEVSISTICRWAKAGKAPKFTGIYEIKYK